jgi:adenine deaminase
MLLSLKKAGISFAYTTADLKDRKDFWKNIRKAIELGLTETTALKSLTQAPAELLAMQNQIGSLNKGMIANFIITSKSIFDKENVIHENWVQGKRYIVKSYGPKDIRGNFELLIENLSPMQLEIKGEAANQQLSIKEDTVKASVTFSFAQENYTLQFELKKKFS